MMSNFNCFFSICSPQKKPGEEIKKRPIFKILRLPFFQKGIETGQTVPPSPWRYSVCPSASCHLEVSEALLRLPLQDQDHRGEAWDRKLPCGESWWFTKEAILGDLWCLEKKFLELIGLGFCGFYCRISVIPRVIHCIYLRLFQHTFGTHP